MFVQHYDSNALDASCLLVPLVRFLPGDDPRVRATVIAVADELSHNGLVLRYRTEETDDGLIGEEGSFLICSFWLVSALLEIGERRRGRALCERLLSLASPLELYAEELDAETGRHLGNSAGLHAPGPHQRGHARDPRRGPRARQHLSAPPRAGDQETVMISCMPSASWAPPPSEQKRR